MSSASADFGGDLRLSSPLHLLDSVSHVFYISVARLHELVSDGHQLFCLYSWSRRLISCIGLLFSFVLNFKRAICKTYFENGQKQTETSFAPLWSLLFLNLLFYNMFLYLYFFYAYNLCIHIVYYIILYKYVIASYDWGKMYMMVMLEPGQTK